MDHGRHSAWTLPLIICILYNKHLFIRCGGVNCYLVNGRLDDAGYNISTLQQHYIIQLHDDLVPQTVLFNTNRSNPITDHRSNFVSHLLDSFRLHYCCQLFFQFTFRKTFCFLTHPGSLILSLPQLARFLRANIYRSGNVKTGILYNLCQTIWRYSSRPAEYSNFSFSLILRKPAELNIFDSLSAHCILFQMKNSPNNKLKYKLERELLFSVSRINISTTQGKEKLVEKKGPERCSEVNCSKSQRHTRQALCEPYQFGHSCNYECHCAQSRPCNTSTGHCPDDLCQLGWHRPNCSVRSCNPDSFTPYTGEECHRCGCKNGGSCNVITGECDMPCEIEIDCDRQACKRNTFSPPNCNKVCACRADSECHPLTGECRTESCKFSNLNPPTCSNDPGDVNLWEKASVLMILTAFFLIKFISFLMI